MGDVRMGAHLVQTPEDVPQEVHGSELLANRALSQMQLDCCFRFVGAPTGEGSAPLDARDLELVQARLTLMRVCAADFLQVAMLSTSTNASTSASSSVRAGTSSAR